MARQKRGFRDHKDPNEGLKNQLKMEVGNEYILKIPADILEQWEEVWPTFNGPDGRITRRFVGDEGSENLKPLFQYKKEVGIPASLDRNDSENWKPKLRYGTVVLTGTEQIVSVGGKKKKKIAWDKTNPKVWLFGIAIFRQLTAINNNVDLQETMEEKGFSTEEHNCTDVFYFRVKKTKKGKEAYQVEYDVQAGKPIGQFKKGAINLDAIEKDFYNYIEPCKESDIQEYLENTGAANSGSEPASVEEVDVPDDQTVNPEDDLDIPELDAPDGAPEPVKSKKGKGRKAKEAPDDDLGLEDDKDDKDSGELDLDDLDGILDD